MFQNNNNYNYQQQQVNFRNNDDHQQFDHHQQQHEINAMDGTNCVMCFQLAMDLSVKEEEIRALKEEKQQEVEILRKEIEKLRLENETLKRDNMRMKKERKQNQENKIATQPQQPQQLFAFGQHVQQSPSIPSRTSFQQQQPETVIYYNRSGAEASSSSASPRKLPSASQEIVPENRNTLNLASKSVLLKQDNTEKQNNSPKRTPIRRNIEQRQEVIRVVDPLEYGNREQFNQVLPNQRNVFGGFSTRNPPIVERNPNPVQQNVRQQPRLAQIPRVAQPPIVQQPNNSIHDDFEYAKKLQEELFNEEINQFNINEDNFSPPNHQHFLHHDLFPLQHNHHANQLILQPFANQQQQDDDLDSYEHNLEAYQDVEVPLKREIWNKLPISHLISGEECTICYSHVCKGERSTTLPCKHFFHTTCIGKWFERKHTCPVCRYDLQ